MLSIFRPTILDILDLFILYLNLKSLICKDDQQLVFLKCGEFDKYGRLLGTIYVNQTDEKSVNDLMIENGYAYEYHGGTKKN